jgi:hypothetical protein
MRVYWLLSLRNQLLQYQHMVLYQHLHSPCHSTELVEQHLLLVALLMPAALALS